MKAIYYNQHGDPDVLEYGELPTPNIEPHQVLVQVAATSVNPIDRRLRGGELQGYITRTFPVVPGWDVAGRIVAVGSGVSGWKVGDDVIGLAFTWSIQHGSYAEFLPIDANAITAKPASLSFCDAAALPLTSLTAWQSLSEFADLRPGQSVLIQAGAGGLGSVSIPIAKYLGAKVYTTAREENFDYLRSLGADHMIDYSKTDYEAALRALEPDGVDVVLESLLGNGTAEAAIRLAKSGGCVAYMNNEPPDIPDINERDIKAEFIHHRPDGVMLKALVDLFAVSKLTIPHIKKMPLHLAAEAHRLSETGRTRGKIVLEIQDM